MKNRCSGSRAPGTLGRIEASPERSATRKDPAIRNLLAQLPIAALGLVLLGCAPERHSAEPGVIVITEAEQTASFIRNFNPFFEWGDVRWPARRAMYEPLMLFNVLSGDFVPVLVTSNRWGPGNRALIIALRVLHKVYQRFYRLCDAEITESIAALDLQFLRDVPVLEDI